MATRYVSQVAGLDTNPGTESQPKKTITGAMAGLANGDIIVVEGGVYPETLAAPSVRHNVTLLAKTGQRPVIEGDGVRATGVNVGFSAITGWRVQGFEIRNFTARGIYLNSVLKAPSNHVVEDCLIHHILGTGVDQFGIRGVQGGRNRYIRNEIHSIGPGGEAMGIKHEAAFDTIVDSNTIYLVRKSGMRLWKERGAKIRNNLIYGCWVGVDLENDNGGLVTNNVLAFDQQGVIFKHTNNLETANTWPGAADGTWWSRVYHNTFWENSHCGINFGSAGGTQGRYADARNNLFGGASHGYVFRGNFDMPTMILDRNVYDSRMAAAARLYMEGYSGTVNRTLEQAQTDRGWELNGLLIPLSDLVDPAEWNFGYPSSSLIASAAVDLGDGYAPQVGARGLSAPRRKLRRRPLTGVSKNFSAGSVANAFDYRWPSQISVQPSPFPQSVVGDFGAPVAITHVVFVPASHATRTNPQSYVIEVSQDNLGWTQVLAGDFGDWEGSDSHLELPSPTVARFLRFTATRNYGGGASGQMGPGDELQTIWGDVWAHFVDPESGASPPVGGGTGGTGSGTGGSTGGGGSAGGGSGSTGGGGSGSIGGPADTPPAPANVLLVGDRWGLSIGLVAN